MGTRLPGSGARPLRFPRPGGWGAPCETFPGAPFLTKRGETQVNDGGASTRPPQTWGAPTRPPSKFDFFLIKNSKTQKNNKKMKFLFLFKNKTKIFKFLT